MQINQVKKGDSIESQQELSPEQMELLNVCSPREAVDLADNLKTVFELALFQLDPQASLNENERFALNSLYHLEQTIRAISKN